MFDHIIGQAMATLIGQLLKVAYRDLILPLMRPQHTCMFKVAHQGTELGAKSDAYDCLRLL